VLRLRPLLYLSRQVEKKEFPSEEDYGVQLHVVDYNLECSFFFAFFIYLFFGTPGTVVSCLAPAPNDQNFPTIIDCPPN